MYSKYSAKNYKTDTLKREDIAAIIPGNYRGSALHYHEAPPDVDQEEICDCVIPPPLEEEPFHEPPPPPAKHPVALKPAKQKCDNKIFGMEMDDILLIGLAILLMNDCEGKKDELLLVIVLVLLLS